MDSQLLKNFHGFLTKKRIMKAVVYVVIDPTENFHLEIS